MHFRKHLYLYVILCNGKTLYWKVSSFILLWFNRCHNKQKHFMAGRKSFTESLSSTQLQNKVKWILLQKKHMNQDFEMWKYPGLYELRQTLVRKLVSNVPQINVPQINLRIILWAVRPQKIPFKQNPLWYNESSLFL